MPEESFGKIILLNGASSAGKSTLARGIQARAEMPFLQFSLDFFMFQTEVLPRRRDSSGPFSWQAMRPKLFSGYFNCLPALARAGNNLVIDYIVETQAQLEALTRQLRGLDVFFVGVHCSVEELERRERQRGDRRIGDARRDLETVHSFSVYDFEVDSSLESERNAERILEAWQVRERPSVFEALGQTLSTA
jgi:chloramphenicol 3-O phosphotransferase